MLSIFFFQAEDGIRDGTVTGVQTVCSSDLPPVPSTKTGGVAVPAVNVGTIGPGGLPRNSSCTLAEVSQLLYRPKPPRITVFPLPVMSQANPTRGLRRLFSVWLSALWVALAKPLATCS